jgi:hypothetical protein
MKDVMDIMAKMVLQRMKITPTETGGMMLYFKFLTGKTLTVEAASLDDVRAVKEMICRMTGIATDQQLLVCNGNQLEDEMPIAECEIDDESALQVVLRLRGGR